MGGEEDGGGEVDAPLNLPSDFIGDKLRGALLSNIAHVREAKKFQKFFFES